MKYFAAYIAMSMFVFAFYVGATWLASFITGTGFLELLPFVALAVVALLETRVILKGNR